MNIGILHKYRHPTNIEYLHTIQANLKGLGSYRRPDSNEPGMGMASQVPGTVMLAQGTVMLA